MLMMSSAVFSILDRCCLHSGISEADELRVALKWQGFAVDAGADASKGLASQKSDYAGQEVERQNERFVGSSV